MLCSMGLTSTGPSKTASSRKVRPKIIAGQTGKSSSYDSRPPGSDSVVAVLLGADANHVIECGYEDLAITDLAGVRFEHNCVSSRGCHLVLHDQVDLELRQEVDDVFRTSVHFGVAFLAAKPFHFVNRQAGNSNSLKLLLHGVESEWFYDRLDLFHLAPCYGLVSHSAGA